MKKGLPPSVVLFLIFTVFALIVLITGAAKGEEETKMWVLCQPDSYVNIRANPKTNAEVTGYLYAGDLVYYDGRTRNDFSHCIGLSTEWGEGWVYKGFLCPSEPVEDGHEYRIEAKGRVACRRSIGGKRRCWLTTDNILTVHLRSDEWCLTNKGFVKTEFINLAVPLDIPRTASYDDMTWEEDS